MTDLELLERYNVLVGLSPLLLKIREGKITEAEMLAEYKKLKPIQTLDGGGKQ